MMLVERGAKRKSKPHIFISHSSRDKAAALNLALTLNFCAVDVWLDDWELDVGQSLTDELARAMEDSRFIAILITENYNKTVWTKTEYKKALAREQREKRTVMLPLIVGEADIPDFLEDKIYIDLRDQYFLGILKLVCMVHEISNFRLSRATQMYVPDNVRDVWSLLENIGFEPYIVVGDDDFKEILENGGKLLKEGYAHFNPEALLTSKHVSGHVKSFIAELDY